MKRDHLQAILEKLEGKIVLSDRFHNQTRNKKVTTSLLVRAPSSWVKIHYKTYPRLSKINLKQNLPRNFLERTILKRESYRAFSNASITLKELSRLLFFSAGITHKGENQDDARRSYPSAGARYPLEVYLISLNVKYLNKGLYHYNVKEHCLEKLLYQDLTGWLLSATGNDRFLKKAVAILIITAVLDRTRIKYKDRGYRYVLIEAGHLAQNLLFEATTLNLGSYPIGGFIDGEFDKLLDINRRKEVTLYLVAIGKRRK